jgi:hypothetical protein
MLEIYQTVQCGIFAVLCRCLQQIVMDTNAVYKIKRKELGKYIYSKSRSASYCRVCPLPVYNITRGGTSRPVYPHPWPLLSCCGAVARLFTNSPLQEKKVGHYHDCWGMLRLLFVEKSLTLHRRLFALFCSAVTGPYRSLTTDMLLFRDSK